MKPLRNGIVVLLVLLVSLTGFVVADAQEYPDFGGQTITITTWSSRPQRYLDEYAPGRLEEAEELFSKGIRLHVIGEIEKLPFLVKEQLLNVVDLTKNNTKSNLVLALSYGSQREILNAVK